MTIASTDRRLAVLIDADNSSTSKLTELLGEVTKYGSPTVKRAYGDWTTPQLGKWKAALHRHAIQPVQQFAFTKGKNATDSALIIDAMDLLYSGHVQGFVLVSSDSDFTRLATRLRESGMAVFGMGERKTPESFVSACEKFIYLDLLDSSEGDDATVPDEAPADRPDLRKILEAAVKGTSGEDGWSHLGAVGEFIGRNHPSFDTRDHGHGKLGELVKAQPYLTVEATASGNLRVQIKDTEREGGRGATARKRQPATKKAPARTSAKKAATS